MNNDGFNIKISKVSLEGVSIPDVQSLIDAKFGDKLKLNVGVNIDNQQFKNIQTQLDSMQKFTGKDINMGANFDLESLKEVDSTIDKIQTKTKWFQDKKSKNWFEANVKQIETINEGVGQITEKIKKWDKTAIDEDTGQKGVWVEQAKVVTENYKEQRKEIEKQITLQQKQATVVKQLALFQEKMSRNIEGLSMRFQDGDINTRQITELRKEMSQLTAESFTPETRARVQGLFDNIVHGAKKSALETKNASIAMQDYLKQHTVIQKQTIQQAMAPMFTQTTQKVTQANSALKQLFQETDKGAHQFGELGNKVNQLNPAMEKTKKVTKELSTEAKGLGNEIFNAGRKFAQWWIIAQFLMVPVRLFRDAIQEIKTLDVELTQLRKVTGESVATMAEFAKTANEIGIAMGASTVEVTKATVEFARLGMSIQQASVMAEKSILLGTVGQMSIEDASKALISTTKAFGIEIDKQGKNVVRVIDMINEVGKLLPLHTAMCG